MAVSHMTHLIRRVEPDRGESLYAVLDNRIKEVNRAVRGKYIAAGSVMRRPGVLTFYYVLTCAKKVTLKQAEADLDTAIAAIALTQLRVRPK